ncbi:hypothetical protein SDJN02_04290, partial [Cucurbita argyrosperma subsp. argyrosperma]
MVFSQHINRASSGTFFSFSYISSIGRFSLKPRSSLSPLIELQVRNFWGWYFCKLAKEAVSGGEATPS